MRPFVSIRAVSAVLLIFVNDLQWITATAKYKGHVALHGASVRTHEDLKHSDKFGQKQVEDDMHTERDTYN